MEIILKLINDSVSGGFWRFMGFWIMVTVILGIPAKLIVVLINRPLRHWNIRKHGYPPTHCDADGDFRDTDDTI